MLRHGSPSLKLGARLQPIRSNPRLQLTAGAGQLHSANIRSAREWTAIHPVRSLSSAGGFLTEISQEATLGNVANRHQRDGEGTHSEADRLAVKVLARQELKRAQDIPLVVRG